MTTAFETLCGQVKSDYPHLDENLLAALIIACIDKRHIVIQAKKTSHVRVTVQYLAEEYLGYKNNHRTLAVHCTSDTTWHQLAKSILVDDIKNNDGEIASSIKSGKSLRETSPTAGLPITSPTFASHIESSAITSTISPISSINKPQHKLPSFLIIENLEKTSKVVQTMIISTLVERKLTVNKKRYQLPDDFVLVIIGHGRNLIPHLRDYMLLEHVVDINQEEYIDESITKSIERMSKDMERMRKDMEIIHKDKGKDVNTGGSEESDVKSNMNDMTAINEMNEMSIKEINESNADIMSNLKNMSKLNNQLEESPPPLIRLSTLPPISLPHAQPISSESFLNSIKLKIPTITISASIQRYMQDIVVALRTHRLIRSGVSPRAVKDFYYLVRAICVLHDYDFVTPSIVSISARKLFPLRIQLCQPKDEPSLNYGGDIDLVNQWMIKWDEELVIEEILTNVPCAM